MAMRERLLSARRLVLFLLFGFCLMPIAHAQSDGAASAVSASGRARIALFELAGQKGDAALTAVLNTVADSVELSLDVLQRYEVKRLPAADPEKDLARVKSYCQANRIDQAIMGSGSAKVEGGYLFKLVVYDRKSDSITLAPEGSSVGALDMFDVTDKLVGTLLDGLSGTHLLFGSLSVESDPAGATVSVNGKEVGTAPLSLRGLPAEAVQVSATLPGYEDVNTSVTITDGESTDAPMKLVRSTGTLALTVPKDAVVSVTSTEIGKKDLGGPGAATLPTGDYDVQATSPGMTAVSAKVTIVRGASTKYLPWPRGYLDVQAVPAGATIVVDGVERGVAPLVVEVEPGTPHHVQLKREKYETYVTDVSAVAGDKTRLAPALVGLPGSIRVETSIAGANVQLDNGPSGKTPFLFEKVQPGPHVIRIANLRVGNSLFVAGDPAPVEVAPGEATLLSKTMVAGKAVLSIKDAPPGSVVQIDGTSVDSEKAITNGIDVTAGWMDIAVQSPTSQKWTGSTFVSPGGTNAVSLYSMTWQIPVVYSMTWMMPKHSNNPQDWAGQLPVWISFPSTKDWGDQPGTLISKGYACRDDNYLYFKYEFSNGSPRKQLSKSIKELDYVQIITTKAGQLTVVIKFTQSGFGTSQKISLGIWDLQKRSWTSLSDNKTAFNIGEGTLEIAVPLDLVRRYVKEEPSQAGLLVADSWEPRSYAAVPRWRLIDFGLR